MHDCSSGSFQLQGIICSAPSPTAHFLLSSQSYLLPQKAETLNQVGSLTLFLPSEAFLTRIAWELMLFSYGERAVLWGWGILTLHQHFHDFSQGSTSSSKSNTDKDFYPPGYAMLGLFHTKQPLEGLMIRPHSKMVTKQVMLVVSHEVLYGK